MRSNRGNDMCILWQLVVASTLGAAISCGGATSRTAPSPAEGSPFPGALAQVICSNVGRCCSVAKPFDEAKCRDTLSQRFKALPLQEGTAFDAGGSGPCLEEIAATARQCGFDGTTYPALASCGDVLGVPSRSKLDDPCDSTCTETGAS